MVVTHSNVHSGLAATVADGDLRDSLIAIRDLLAGDLDEATWDRHKAQCHCECGMADVRARVAIAKELRATLDAIEALPAAEEGSRLDRIAARGADEVANRRALRFAGADGS